MNITFDYLDVELSNTVKKLPSLQTHPKWSEVDFLKIKTVKKKIILLSCKYLDVKTDFYCLSSIMLAICLSISPAVISWCQLCVLGLVLWWGMRNREVVLEEREDVLIERKPVFSCQHTPFYSDDLGQITSSSGDLISSLQSSTGLLWGQIRLMGVKIPY